MNNNPFTLMYGIASQSIVTREDSLNKIINSFTLQNNMQTYLITGLRGTGKTVLLRTVEEQLSNKKDWVVLNVNPQGEILNSIASKLYDLGLVRKIIGKISLSINLGIITLTRESGDKTNDPEIIIEYILEKFRLTGLKVLISIDEVNKTNEFRKFINFYQVLIAKQFPIYLLMTALQENINSLINDKAMTFLSRAPKIVLEPLSLPSIALNYAEIFQIDNKKAAEMAKLTNGYAFAYQVLGYLLYESKKQNIDEELITSFDRYLWANGYNKFWSDLTNIERKFLIALAMGSGDKESIIQNGFMETNYSQYRRRLLEKGLIYTPKQGSLNFVLPRFKEYVLLMKEFEN